MKGKLDNLYQAIYKDATLGIIIADKKGVIAIANQFAEKLFGYDHNSLNGVNVDQLIPTSKRGSHHQHREGYMKKPSPRVMGANLDLYGVKKDGQEFPVVVSLSYTKIEDDAYAIAYISDNSEARKLLSDIKKSQNNLDEAQRLGLQGSFEVDMINKSVTWSKGMFDLYGVTQSEFDPMYDNHISMIHPDDREEVKDYLKIMNETKEGLDYGYRITKKNNEVRFLEGRREVVLNEDGDVVKIIGLLQDVTELREAKSISEDVFNIVEESLNEVFIFNQTDLRFIRVNRGARLNTGYSLEELIAMTPLGLCPEYDMESFRSVLQPLDDRTQEKVKIETLHKRKNGSIYPVAANIQLSKLGDKKVYVAFLLDISERKSYEKKLLEYSDQLEVKIKARTNELEKSKVELEEALQSEKQLNELKSRFVSMASHEFRTPLSTVLSSAGLIAKYTETDQQDKREKHVKKIKSAVKNLTTILNDFLSLEKLESGKVSRHNPTSINLHEYIADITDEVMTLARTGQSILHTHTGHPEILIDEPILHNILINLLSNALKYSEDNQQCEVISKVSKKSLSIQIKDKGIGIPEEEQKLLFTRFFRANNVSNIQGTGLGLTIVKRYLNILGGDISFSSVSGKGTTFTVTIPLPD